MVQKWSNPGPTTVQLWTTTPSRWSNWTWIGPTKIGDDLHWTVWTGWTALQNGPTVQHLLVDSLGLIPCGVVGESVGAPGAMGYPGERARLVFERAAEVLRVREWPSEEESHPGRVGVHIISPETTDLTIERGPSQDSGSLRGLQRSFSSMGIGGLTSRETQSQKLVHEFFK